MYTSSFFHYYYFVWSIFFIGIIVLVLTGTTNITEGRRVYTLGYGVVSLLVYLVLTVVVKKDVHTRKNAARRKLLRNIVTRLKMQYLADRYLDLMNRAQNPQSPTASDNHLWDVDSPRKDVKVTPFEYFDNIGFGGVVLSPYDEGQPKNHNNAKNDDNKIDEIKKDVPLFMTQFKKREGIAETGAPNPREGEVGEGLFDDVIEVEVEVSQTDDTPVAAPASDYTQERDLVVGMDITFDIKDANAQHKKMYVYNALYCTLCSFLSVISLFEEK
ncbi:hypothetical protein RFI_14078 [Reticulomyxa filosa]|uniref:Uncharacterized protein n=1 Tax=Reticulomyxa filosa TaxID=46433 RepID=X6NCQ8_RETFI|nr:hypothetical protein RFI_14078 [Reticulomyxa filosa]|eukprot:ETO23107.1 hypothetical protein RFI_14078 [Reticulomyxa filosa]